MLARSLLSLVLATGCWSSSSPSTSSTPPTSPEPGIASITVTPVEEPPPPPPKPAAAPSKPIAEQPIVQSPGGTPGSQATIAANLNREGAADFAAGKFGEAMRKFREAAARVPEPIYFFNLCLTGYREGKFDDALVACFAGSNMKPPSDLDKRIKKLVDTIMDEAKHQGLDIRPPTGGGDGP
jgi:hypothetical protein